MKAYMAPELRKQYCGPGRDRTCDQRIMRLAVDVMTGSAHADSCVAMGLTASGQAKLLLIHAGPSGCVHPVLARLGRHPGRHSFVVTRPRTPQQANGGFH